MIDFYNWVSELATLEEFPDLQTYFIIDCTMQAFVFLTAVIPFFVWSNKKMLLMGMKIRIVYQVLTIGLAVWGIQIKDDLFLIYDRDEMSRFDYR